MPKHVLAVDDDPHVLELLRALLTDEGYQASIHSRDDTAFDHIARTRPDAVILDIRMQTPGAGLQILDRLTQTPPFEGLSIIVCSADIKQLNLHAERLAAAGCAILPKPFDLDDLLDVLRQRIGSP